MENFEITPFSQLSNSVYLANPLQRFSYENAIAELPTQVQNDDSGLNEIVDLLAYTFSDSDLPPVDEEPLP